MAATLVASVTAGSPDGNGFTTGAINTTGANYLVAVVSFYTFAADPVVSDSKGNSWLTMSKTDNGGSGCATKFYFSYNPSSLGPGHTFTLAGGGTYTSIVVFAWASMLTMLTSQDQESGVSVSGATSIQPGSITPVVDNEVVITGICYELATTMSIDSGFSAIVATDFGSGTHFGVAAAYRIQTTAAAVNPTWSWSAGNRSTTTRITSFKSAAGAAGTIPGFQAPFGWK